MAHTPDEILGGETINVHDLAESVRHDPKFSQYELSSEKNDIKLVQQLVRQNRNIFDGKKFVYEEDQKPAPSGPPTSSPENKQPSPSVDTDKLKSPLSGMRGPKAASISQGTETNKSDSVIGKVADFAGKYAKGMWDEANTPLLEGAEGVPKKIGQMSRTAPALQSRDKDNTLGNSAKDMMQGMSGFAQGLMESGIQFSTPLSGLMAVASAIAPEAKAGSRASKLVRAAKAFASGTITADMVMDLAEDLPEVYKSVQDGDMTEAGRHLAKGMTELVLGSASARESVRAKMAKDVSPAKGDTAPTIAKTATVAPVKAKAAVAPTEPPPTEATNAPTEKVATESVPAKPEHNTAEKPPEVDPMYNDAVKVVVEAGKASTSTLQRKLGLPYTRAASILDKMHSDGIIGPADGSKPREILLKKKSDWPKGTETFSETPPESSKPTEKTKIEENNRKIEELKKKIKESKVTKKTSEPPAPKAATVEKKEILKKAEEPKKTVVSKQPDKEPVKPQSSTNSLKEDMWRDVLENKDTNLTVKIAKGIRARGGLKTQEEFSKFVDDFIKTNPTVESLKALTSKYTPTSAAKEVNGKDVVKETPKETTKEPDKNPPKSATTETSASHPERGDYFKVKANPDNFAEHRVGTELEYRGREKASNGEYKYHFIDEDGGDIYATLTPKEFMDSISYESPKTGAKEPKLQGPPEPSTKSEVRQDDKIKTIDNTLSSLKNTNKFPAVITLQSKMEGENGVLSDDYKVIESYRVESAKDLDSVRSEIIKRSKDLPEDSKIVVPKMAGGSSIDSKLGVSRPQPKGYQENRVRERLKNTSKLDTQDKKDLYAVGKSKYNPGDDYTRWAVRMAQNFGRAIVPHLPEVWDRVQAG